MTQRNRGDDRDSATAPEYYLPAVITPSSEPSRLERLWSKLFSQYGEPPN